jgi:hypothetical protein
MVALIFLSQHISKTGKSRIHTTPYSFLMKNFSRLRRQQHQSQQNTLEGISRDREHGITCCKDQYFQAKLNPCVTGAKYCILIVFTN